MNIYEQIKSDMILALKEKRVDDKEVLSLVFSKLKNKAIDLRQEALSDIDSIAIIQKFVKELDEDIENYKKANREETVTKLIYQQGFIKKYLPQMLSEDEIKNIISAMDDKSIPSVMKYFKANYAGKVDMGLVSKVARSF